MAKKIIAIVASYRKTGITHQTVDVMLEEAKAQGCQVQKIDLLEKHIEFCTNCRQCTQNAPDLRRGNCVIKDDMAEILDKVDDADGLIMAGPINFGCSIALLKRFIERLVVYAYWPWEKNIPKGRITSNTKKAITVTSSACPGLIGRILMPSSSKTMKTACDIAGAKVVKKIHLGLVSDTSDKKLTSKQLDKLAKTVHKIIS